MSIDIRIITSIIFFLGTVSSIVGTIYIKNSNQIGILIYLIASSIFFLVSILDLIYIINKRPKTGIDVLIYNSNIKKKINHYKINLSKGILFLIGGIFYISASLMLTDYFKQKYISFWFCLIGSISYILGSLIIIIYLIKVRNNVNKKLILKFVLFISFILGALSFIVGIILNHLDINSDFYVLLSGSSLYTFGSIIGILINSFK